MSLESNFQGITIARRKVTQRREKEKHGNFSLQLAKVRQHVMDVVFEKKKRAQVKNILSRRSRP